MKNNTFLKRYICTFAKALKSNLTRSHRAAIKKLKNKPLVYRQDSGSQTKTSVVVVAGEDFLSG